MKTRHLIAALGLLACLLPGNAQAGSYTQDQFSWCRDNMRDAYQAAYDSCVHTDCARISIKKAFAKSACYHRCKEDAVQSCLDQRGQARNAPTPSPRPQAQQQKAVDKAMPATAGQAAPQAQETARVPGRAVPEAKSPEAQSPEAQSPEAKSEDKPQGFFDRLTNTVNNMFDAAMSDEDYTWCRDKSGGYFQQLMSDCRRDCGVIPISNSSRRQACLSSCRKDSLTACIAHRDGH